MFVKKMKIIKIKKHMFYVKVMNCTKDFIFFSSVELCYGATKEDRQRRKSEGHGSHKGQENSVLSRA